VRGARGTLYVMPRTAKTRPRSTAPKPPAPAGYSGTPLVAKLGIREGHRLAVLDGPEAFEGTLGPLPAGVSCLRSLARGTPFDVVIRFVHSRADLVAAFAPITTRMQQAGAIWIAWPKKASKIATDMTEDVVREVVLPLGWVDNKVCAIDATWSGLRCVLRRELRR
jgi:hypothetical protein